MEPNPTNLPWCFYSTDYEDPCGSFIWTEAGPGFTDEFYNTMFEKYYIFLMIAPKCNNLILLRIRRD